MSSSGWEDISGFLRQYLRAYGGVWASVKSPYFIGAVALAAATSGLWRQAGWWDTVLTIHPSMLGFTLGALALILATATDKFGAILAKARQYDGDVLLTPLAQMGAAFVHFLLLQFVSIILAVLAKSFYSISAPTWASWLGESPAVDIFWGGCAIIALYALTSAVAATEWMFTILLKLVRYHQVAHKFEKKQQD